jgi:hypothetical protein
MEGLCAHAFGWMSGFWVRAVRWDGMEGKHSWVVILETLERKWKKTERARDRHNKQAKRYYLQKSFSVMFLIIYIE